MKFKCGRTEKELVAAQDAWDRWDAARKQWHRWYAWYPVSVAKGDCRWLEAVQRKWTMIHGDRGGWIWEYRACS